jgi:hypothetical protein
VNPHHSFGIGVVGATLAILAACGSSSSPGSGVGTDGGEADGGSGEGGVTNPPGCPPTPPAFNSACEVSGTTCRYGTCETTIASCEAGRWNMPSSPATPACPEIVPDNGAKCCSPSGTVCNYDCAHGKGANSTATCKDGAWSVAGFLSPCSAADAGADSGCSTAGSTCCDPYPGDGPNYCSNGLHCCGNNLCAVSCN